MTSFNRRVYEMLVRVGVFASTHPEFFPKDSQMGQLVQKIEEAVHKLSANAVSEQRGKGAERASASDRARARTGVRAQLATINRTARGLQVEGFWLPRDNGDRALVEFGRLFAQNAEPLKQAFIDSHLPPDFIETLIAATKDLDRSIQTQAVSSGSRLSAAATIAQTRSDALAALQRLDPMVENLLRADQPTLAVWERARRVGRGSKPATGGESNQPDPVPPVANTGATASQA